MSNALAVEFSHVEKSYGAYKALRGITAKVNQGEVVVICGPSGSGKSTLIRTVNRLEEIDGGRIVVNGQDVHSSKSINDMRSRIGFVFQQFNLFPHLTAAENVALGLRYVRKVSRSEAMTRATDLLASIGLETHAAKYPGQLSGGQQQRVAIARALALEPPLMLFDEPTSALDVEMVGEVLNLMQSLANRKMTMICVTHEMSFARQIADHVWFMEAGELVEVSSGADFFDRPQHPRAKSFVEQLRRQHAPSGGGVSLSATGAAQLLREEVTA